MSHDASPSSAARIDAFVPNLDDETAWRAPSELNGSSRRRASSRTRRRKKKKISRRRRNPGLAKKLAFITHLLRNLDTLVFAELSALYYMECSMFRFILRAVGQYMYLTPKDEAFPFLMPASRMHVMLVAIPNLICMLLHLFTSLPSGPDYHRGYMHGGMVIDFIGQKPPTSRLYYILADIAILAIQCLMLSVHTEREKLRVTLKTFRPLIPELIPETAAAPTIEDLDAEERGISRDLSGITTTNDTDDIELRPLRHSGEEEESTERNGESPSLSRENSTEESSRSHLSDLLSSGNAVLGEYHIVQSIRLAAMDLERTAAHSLRTLSYGATMAAIEARRRGTNVSANVSANISIRPPRPDRE
ncbi:Fc.00g067130.m01.CDS01 [Cosmosporella sp. VM-42]